MHHSDLYLRGFKTTLAVTAAASLVVGCTALVVFLTDGHRRVASTAATVPVVSSPALVTGAVVAPTPSPPAAVSSVVATGSTPSPVSTPPAGPLIYTVKPGDTLTSIASWFHMHGYGTLYEANKSVIGRDPSLIHPGQVITVSTHGMTVH